MKIKPFSKKRKTRKRKRIKIEKLSNIKCIFLVIFLTLFIIFNRRIFPKLPKNANNKNEINDDNIIQYKGEKIQRDELINNYLSKINSDKKSLLHEKELFNQLYFLPEYTEDPISQNKIKNQLLSSISRYKRQRINKIETLFLFGTYNFGNSVIRLNNIIFYCEILGCNKIILNDFGTSRTWLIKNQIYIEKSNITITLGHNVNCDSDTIFCPRSKTWNGFHPIIVKPQIRTQYIKEEIIRNLPKVITDTDDLYIHIRGGDIFQSKEPLAGYAQPPLCFYEKVINNNKFKHIYIVSMDRLNVVLNALTDKYKDIIFKQNDYEYDLSLLINAFNIIASASSFLISAIKFNDNLKDLWEYDINQLSKKFLFLHHHVYKFDIKYKIYTMKPSDAYVDKMFVWSNKKSQLKLMIEDTCPYDFVLTKPNT